MVSGEQLFSVNFHHIYDFIDINWRG